jgi:hypothetical protein
MQLEDRIAGFMLPYLKTAVKEQYTAGFRINLLVAADNL